MTGTAQPHATPAPSAEQRAVRERAGAPTVLVAAAGSGKTRVLTWLYTDAHLREGIAIERLLAITFTNRAASELRERIALELRGTALGRDPDLTDAWIGTFHGVCARLLREFAHHRGLDPGFTVIDELAAAELQSSAWEDALLAILDDHGDAAADLVAQVGEGALRSAVLDWWTARRSDGAVHPELPTPITGDAEVLAAVRDVRRAASELEAVVSELSGPSGPGKRLTQTLEIIEESVEAASAIAQLVERPPVHAAPAARLLAALQARKPHRGRPLGSDHPALLAFLQARDVLATRLGELVAGPRVVILAQLVRAFSEAYERHKRSDECLDHDDLELEALQLLRDVPSVRAQLAERFARIYVDEFQDTNRRQAELIELLSGERPWLHATRDVPQPVVTVVGDPRQAIYGFRNASVELIRAAQRDAPPGVALQLSTNYRSDAAVLAAIDRAWARLDGEHQPVCAHRGPEPLDDGGVRVELLVTKNDRGEPWDGAQLGGAPGAEAGALLAEARLVAARVAELRRRSPDASIAVLARQRRVLVPISSALAALGVDAVQDGADGFWERLEVADLMMWLRLVRNRRDDAALLMVLASPLAALSTEALAVVGEHAGEGLAGTRLEAVLVAAERGEFSADDRARITHVARLLERHREEGRDADPGALLDDLISATRYDEHLALLHDGQRRLANVSRLRRLAAAEVASGGDLGSLVDRAASEQRHGLRAPEAALAGGGAVQLMTIHQAKGLEFDAVVVAGLGQQGRSGTPAILGEDARLGLRLRPAPGAKAQPLFEHTALAAEQAARERDELRRVLYVALTRAREQLIVSGVALWKKNGAPFGDDLKDSAPVIDWLGPALVSELPSLLDQAAVAPCRSAEGVQVCVSTPGGEILPLQLRAPRPVQLPEHRPPVPEVVAAAQPPLAAPVLLSYTALSRHAACGLRFYAEELLRLPATAPLPLRVDERPAGRQRNPSGASQLSLFAGDRELDASPADAAGAADAPRLPANVVGTIVHAVLERAPRQPTAAQLDAAVRAESLACGVAPSDAEHRRMVEMASAAVNGPLWQELWQDGAPQRERGFTVALAGGQLLHGVVDAQARLADGSALVVDYKTDRLDPAVDLGAHVAERYRLQRAAYAFAALRDGAGAVRVVHVFLDGGVGRHADLQVDASDVAALDAQLARAVAPVVAGEAGATAAPDALTCDGCPARGTVCRWPVALTQRVPGSGVADRAAWTGDPSAVRVETGGGAPAASSRGPR